LPLSEAEMLTIVRNDEVIATQQNDAICTVAGIQKITQQKLSEAVFLLHIFILPSCAFLTIAAVKILL
jgi:hypothetical protein